MTTSVSEFALLEIEICQLFFAKAASLLGEVMRTLLDPGLLGRLESVSSRCFGLFNDLPI